MVDGGGGGYFNGKKGRSIVDGVIGNGFVELIRECVLEMAFDKMDEGVLV